MAGSHLWQCDMARYQHGCDSVNPACWYTAISQGYECDVAFIQQQMNKWRRNNYGVSLKKHSFVQNYFLTPLI